MGKELRVLIVEDSEDDALLLLREIRKGGFDVKYERVDMAAAMRAALERQDWEIVVCDYVMPEFSGPEALRLLQETGVDIPFIVISGKVGEEVAVEMMKAGAHDYLVKGNLARLIPAINRELREAQIRRERREADEALRQAHAELELRVKERTAELEQANKNLRDLQRARDDFVNAVSHDLRNPLQLIQGHAQLIQRSAGQADLVSKGIEVISTSAKRMNAMIQDLVDSARLEGGQLRLECQPVDLRPFVDELVGRLAGMWAEGRLESKIPMDLPEVDADPDRLERIMLNLLTNALKYSPAEATVTVSAAREKGMVKVWVTDRGEGIAPEDQAHIFERFFRASGQKVGGIGLGLHITKMLVEAHGGRLWVESPSGGRMGKGSTFYFTLPKVAAKGAKARGAFADS
ncbi:MAG: hybrid sensor histidine kinase/response regulator [Chloroflexi bacterium]|nr:hybrid sensor histidine kinase/response regulator [Chloroflexota bacterium]